MIDQEYFTVQHALKVNIEKLDPDFTFPEESAFEAEIPTPFIIANEFSQLDSMNDLAKQELRERDLKHVVQLLDAQNSKLNLLLNFMLAQQDDINTRYTTTSFGASQFTFLTGNVFAEKDKLRVKLFIESPASAIYFYGHVSNCELTEQQYQVTVKYDLMRENDQDILIKAALFRQQKLLRQRSLERNK
ncbi:PilZ domain-containing protein [Vibrio salinus]|uniref:PilZ domain-containing protein n=1 Tax=Vibrio salinus TaxID=2899784 RepID=UPI001E3A382C|nr:PilZ domain-containing protein [Vibrio salinus]MCE0492859.1 PilZ domain-containing protein [Vibrio salinus]